jgi:hypothetical protein
MAERRPPQAPCVIMFAATNIAIDAVSRSKTKDDSRLRP